MIWDGQYGSPYEIDLIIKPELRDTRALREYDWLFDHTKRFKPRGSGNRKAVLAITSPYQRDDARTRAAAQEFADRFGLAVRFNNLGDRIYNIESTIPIVFWRPDLHDLR